MKKLIIGTLLLLAAISASAQSERSILLTPTGTLYAVETKVNEDPSFTHSATYLEVTIQTAGRATRMTVPASLTGGNNWQAELAYDPHSEALFVFWIHSENSILAANSLLFCSYQNGHWTAPTSIDDTPYHIRHNLRIGVTRTVERIEASGLITVIPTLTVHTVWWDESGDEQIARYAMLTIEKGSVTDVQRRDLRDYINTAYLKNFTSGASSEMLQQPVILESPAHDTVDVVFGVLSTNTLHRLTLKPVLNSRVRIPIGVRETSYPGPVDRIGIDGVRLSAISTTPDKVVFFTKTASEVTYLVFEEGEWNAAKTIVLSPQITADAAVAALRKMVSGD